MRPFFVMLLLMCLAGPAWAEKIEFSRAIPPGDYVLTYTVDSPPKTVNGVSAATQPNLPAFTNGLLKRSVMELAVDKPGLQVQVIHVRYRRLVRNSHVLAREFILDTDVRVQRIFSGLHAWPP